MRQFVLSAVACLLLCDDSAAQRPAQVTPQQITERIGQEPRHSVAGKSIVSWWMSPRLTAEQEMKFTTAMNTPVTGQWSDIPLSRVLQDLSKIFPVELDEQACEEIGIQPRHPVTITVSDDSTLETVLNQIKKPLDLRIQLAADKVIVTTAEAAEGRLLIKIYDVTPIMGPTMDTASLIKTVQTTIVPDTWSLIGGPSVLTSAESEGRVFLSIDTTTEVHGLCEAFLNRLNRSSQGADSK